MKILNAIAGSVITIVSFGWLYLGYWLWSTLMLIPEWISSKVDISVLALKILATIPMIGAIIMWLLIFAGIVVIAIGVYVMD